MGVQLNIKNEEAVALAREIAEATGVSVTEAIHTALRERRRALEQQNRFSRDALAEREQRFRGLVDGLRGRWREDVLAVEHGDLLYDERGLPR
jgi:antitoxin VapB